MLAAATGMVISESMRPKRLPRLKSLRYIALVFLTCLTAGGRKQPYSGPSSTPLAYHESPAYPISPS
jgi:hypothetical protein